MPSPINKLGYLFFSLAIFIQSLALVLRKGLPASSLHLPFLSFLSFFTASVQTILSPLWEPHDTFCINFTRWGWERQQKCSLLILTTDIFPCPSYFNVYFIILTSPNSRESQYSYTQVNGSLGQWSGELTESLLYKPDPSSPYFQAISSTF